jgi:hypothetical protein
MSLWHFGAVGTTLLLAGVMHTGGQAELRRGTVTFADNTTVRVEVAATRDAMARGLMFRKALDEHDGMLFVFDAPGFYPFWMQNCVIPLDIIWIGVDNRIVSIAANAQPCKLPGCDPPCASDACPTIPPKAGTVAQLVVEVAAGFAERHHVAVGQAVTIRR